jgi:hypothetical protein
MRFLSPLFLALMTLPVLAFGWGHYQNARFGYAIEVPQQFMGAGESDNGDGQIFRYAARAQVLTVWGGQAIEGFEAETAAMLEAAAEDGWTVSYQATTPTWAHFKAQRGERRLHQRMIALCGGTQYAAFALEYAMQEVADVEMVIERLERSLVATGC